MATWGQTGLNQLLGTGWDIGGMSNANLAGMSGLQSPQDMMTQQTQAANQTAPQSGLSTILPDQQSSTMGTPTTSTAPVTPATGIGNRNPTMAEWKASMGTSTAPDNWRSTMPAGWSNDQGGIAGGGFGRDPSTGVGWAGMDQPELKNSEGLFFGASPGSTLLASDDPIAKMHPGAWNDPRTGTIRWLNPRSPFQAAGWDALGSFDQNMANQIREAIRTGNTAWGGWGGVAPNVGVDISQQPITTDRPGVFNAGTKFATDWDPYDVNDPRHATITNPNFPGDPKRGGVRPGDPNW